MGIASSGKPELNHRQQRKRTWDAILVGIGMTVAFSIVMIRLTGFFPCDIVNELQILDTSCNVWVESNWNAIVDRFSGFISQHLQVP